MLDLILIKLSLYSCCILSLLVLEIAHSLLSVTYKLNKLNFTLMMCKLRVKNAWVYNFGCE